MSDDITGDLDLLGDWLDAKGYTEEAGLCTRAMDEINKLRAALNALIEAADNVRHWHDAMKDGSGMVVSRHSVIVLWEKADEARAAALKETGDD